MNLRIVLILAIAWLALATDANATEFTLSPALNSQLNALALQPRWLTLLHDKSTRLGHHWRSEVDDAKFFLAPDGKTNPAAEMRATLEAFYQPVHKPDDHAVCHYPARWQWLTQKLTLPPTPITPAECPEFQHWLNAIKPDSVTLVFASSYLNSPSSMFGHTFLRVDPANISTGSTWLSYAVSFGAQVKPEDNSIVYAYKGLFGGYPGYFSVQHYQNKLNEYSRLENRDLWEYRLNLTPVEVKRLMWHLWELRDIDFSYYFFDKNCSYRLLELLQVARPGIDLTSGFQWRAIPIDTVREVKQAGLVKAVDYQPAKDTDLQFQADLLTPQQQQLAWDLAHNKRKLDDPQLLALPNATQVQVLRVAYKHLRYLQLNKERDSDAAQTSLAILRALRDRPTTPVAQPPRPIAPEDGHDTLLAGISGGRTDGNGFVDLHLRTSYHDLLDNPDGYLDGAAINLGELILRQREHDSLQLEMLNLVDIQSHSPRTLFFDPITWRVRAGFDRVYSKADDALTPRINGGAGFTWLLGHRDLFYTMAVARVEYDSLLKANLGVGAGALAGGLFYLPFGTLQLEGNYLHFSDGNARFDLKLTHNLPLDRDDALRFTAMRRQQLDTRFNEVSLEYRHYF